MGKICQPADKVFLVLIFPKNIPGFKPADGHHMVQDAGDIETGFPERERRGICLWHSLTSVYDYDNYISITYRTVLGLGLQPSSQSLNGNLNAVPHSGYCITKLPDLVP